MQRPLIALVSACLAVAGARAQQVQSQPGQFDFYLLNLSWAPEFCSTLDTLTPQERVDAGSDMECANPHTFVLHGLWPQNTDGTYPGSCSSRPGPVHPERNLDMTPNLALLRHEWAKHGTCTTLSPEAFFATARQAYTAVAIPDQLKRLDRELMVRPDELLAMFYRSNPSFPRGSFTLACGGNRLTAIEACFSREDIHPIACEGVRACIADTIRVTPEASGAISTGGRAPL